MHYIEDYHVNVVCYVLCTDSADVLCRKHPPACYALTVDSDFALQTVAFEQSIDGHHIFESNCLIIMLYCLVLRMPSIICIVHVWCLLQYASKNIIHVLKMQNVH